MLPAALRTDFTRNQVLTIAVFCVADFCQAVCVSLQAPFYPQEAEKKGATATEYGLVFGVFELTVFLVSPWVGKNLNRIGAKRCFNFGILTTGTCSVLFGFLDRIPTRGWFIGLSFVIRIVEAVGNSCFLNATFTIIAKEFPNNVATMFALLETFFGLGLIVGPSVGGALYQVGGFTLPFGTLGGCLVTFATITFFSLPSNYNDAPSTAGAQSVKRALKIPSVAVAVLSILCASSSIGFLVTSLEPHMRQFKLSPVMMGVMFVINGAAYAVTAPLYGVFIDKGVSPRVINVVGAVFIIISFLFIGPAPFIPIKTGYELCIGSLVVHGAGIGAVLVSSFSISHKEAVKNGFPDSIETYGLISGLWTSTFAFGAFVGPSIAGLLMDHFGFRYATLFIVTFSVLHVLVSAVFYGRMALTKRKQNAEGYVAINGENNANTPSYGAITNDDDGEQRRSPSIGYSSGSASDPSSPERSDVPGELPTYRIGSRGATGLGNLLSPKSPFTSGPTSMLGGVLGYSIPFSASSTGPSGADSANEMPHEYDATGGPPQRGQTQQQLDPAPQPPKKRSSRGRRPESTSSRQ